MSLNWINIRNNIIVLFISTLITLLIIEGISAYLVSINKLSYYKFPEEKGLFWQDINEDFGVWRNNNDSYRDVRACFDVTYNTNSYGARDKERTLNGSNRVLVLGDSFIEGYGVDEKFRVTDILEAKTNLEHLNFGISGSFGSIQQMLLYKTLASKFEHTKVFIFLLPNNDFLDNSFEFGERFHQERYRPYLDKDKNVFYFNKNSNYGQVTSPIKLFIYKILNKSYFLNAIVIDVIQPLLYQYALEETRNNDHAADVNVLEKIDVGDSYVSMSQEDWETLKYTYNEIAKYLEKEIYIFSIPTILDFEYYENYDDIQMVHKLNKFADNNNKIQYFDLLPYFVDYAKNNKITYDEFFLPCDGHWSKLGNEVATLAVKDFAY